MGIGGEIFNFFGALARWLYGTIWRTIARKKKYSFMEYLRGPKHSDGFYDDFGHELVNRFVGLIVIILLGYLLS